MSRSFLGLLCAITVVFSAFVVWQNRLIVRDLASADPPKLLPAHRLPVPADAQTATFAGGCFWGVEETFRLVPGVVDTQAGYTGGTSQHPTYRNVHSDRTGHVEAVKVIFDPARVTYAQLLNVFFDHRPVSTTAASHRKIGSPYRDMVFTANAAQNTQAQKLVQTLRAKEAVADPKGTVRRLAVGIVPAREFWPAEEEHQRYYEKRGGEAASGAFCRSR